MAADGWLSCDPVRDHTLQSTRWGWQVIYVPPSPISPLQSAHVGVGALPKAVRPYLFQGVCLDPGEGLSMGVVLASSPALKGGDHLNQGRH